ncbi:MAG: hypothetical protein IKN56_01105 [Clostridia bacterium]|nr:hypothetical protein [Clostridia bacterium]
MKDKIFEMITEGRIVFPLTDVAGNVTGAVGSKLGVKLSKSESCGYGFFGSFNTDKDAIMISDNFSDARIARSIGYDNVIGFLPGRDQETFTEEALCAIATINKKIILKYGRDDFGRSWAEDLSLRMKERGIEVYICFHEWSERDNISKFKKELDKMFAVAY